MLGSISVGGTVNKSGVNNSTHPDYLAALEPLSTEVAQSMLVGAAHTSAGASPPKSHPATEEISNLSDTPSKSTNFTSHTNQTSNVGPVGSLPVEEDPKSTQEQAQEIPSQDWDSEDFPRYVDSEEYQLKMSSDSGRRTLRAHWTFHSLYSTIAVITLASFTMFRWIPMAKIKT